MTLNKRGIVVMPVILIILHQTGEQIKFARLRRQLSAELTAERAEISRATLWNVEKGSPSASMGPYAAALHALRGMKRDLLMEAKDDEFDRKLQDLDLLPRKRAPKMAVIGKYRKQNKVHNN